MPSEVRAEIYLGSQFIERGKNVPAEVFLASEIYRSIENPSKSLGLQVVKREIVLPDGETKGMRYETTYDGALSTNGLIDQRNNRFGLRAVVQDLPFQAGHNVMLVESLEIDLPGRGGKICLKEAILAPTDLAQVCHLDVSPDRKEEFLGALSIFGYNLVELRRVTNGEEWIELNRATHAVGRYLQSFSS